MAYFFDSAARTPKELLPGIVSRTFWGERMLLSLVDLEANATIPPHSHPHEQIGMVVQRRDGTDDRRRDAAWSGPATCTWCPAGSSTACGWARSRARWSKPSRRCARSTSSRIEREVGNWRIVVAIAARFRMRRKAEGDLRLPTTVRSNRRDGVRRKPANLTDLSQSRIICRNQVFHGSLAQLAEHLTLNQRVQGSSPWRLIQF